MSKFQTIELRDGARYGDPNEHIEICLEEACAMERRGSMIAACQALERALTAEKNLVPFWIKRGPMRYDGFIPGIGYFEFKKDMDLRPTDTLTITIE